MSRKTAVELLTETMCPRCGSVDLKGEGFILTALGFIGDETRDPNHLKAQRRCVPCGLVFVHHVQASTQLSRYLVNGRQFGPADYEPLTADDLDRWEHGARPGQEPGDDWTDVVCRLIDEVRRLRAPLDKA